MIGRSKATKWLRWVREGATIFSTCGKRNYMAVVLDGNGHVLGTGYNGGPKGSKHCVDGGCPRFIEGSANGSSYDNCIAIHAEQNALLHSDYSARQGGTLIINGPPCFTCAKLIVNSGVTQLVYLTDDAYAQWPEIEKFLVEHGVDLMGWGSDELDG